MTQMMSWMPAEGLPEQLMVLLHGVGSNAAGMTALAEKIRREYPQAAIVAPNGFAPFEGDPEGGGRQWFSVAGVTEENRAQRVAAVLPALADWVTQMQQRLVLGPQATALWGFSQGAILALALAQARDGIAGRVVAFAGRYAELPEQAPRQTTLHLLHGEADAVIPVAHARAAIERLALLQGDATIDIAQATGHEISAALLQRAFFRLRNHIPHRSWAAALGAARGLSDHETGDEPH